MTHEARTLISASILREELKRLLPHARTTGAALFRGRDDENESTMTLYVNREAHDVRFPWSDLALSIDDFTRKYFTPKLIESLEKITLSA